MSKPSRFPTTEPEIASAGALDWGATLAEHERWLRRVVASRLGEPQAVDEVMQDVALAAVAQRSPLHNPARAAVWLYRLAVRHVLIYRRKIGPATIACRSLRRSSAAPARSTRPPRHWPGWSRMSGRSWSRMRCDGSPARRRDPGPQARRGLHRPRAGRPAGRRRGDRRDAAAPRPTPTPHGTGRAIGRIRGIRP